MKSRKNVIKKSIKQFKNYITKIIEIIKKPEMLSLPGEIAFFMLLSIVPIITFVGVGASLFNINMGTVIDMINELIPGGASKIIPYIIGDSFDLKLGIIFVIMFYLASGGFDSVIIISNRIYGIKQSNWFKRKIKALFMTLGIVIMLTFILVVPVFGSKILAMLEPLNVTEQITNIYHFLRGPILWVILFLFIRGIYEIAPDRVRKNSHLNTGAIFTTIGWITVTKIYGFFAENMSTYNMFYGTLANVAFLMLWLYYISVVFVIGLALNYGVEVDAELERTMKLEIVEEIKDELKTEIKEEIKEEIKNEIPEEKKKKKKKVNK